MAIPDNTTVFDPEKSPILEDHQSDHHGTFRPDETPVDGMPIDFIITAEQLPLFDPNAIPIPHEEAQNPKPAIEHDITMLDDVVNDTNQTS